MEAWIVHVREEAITGDGTTHYAEDIYGVWATEELAQKAVKTYLMKITDPTTLSFPRPLGMAQRELSDGIRALLQADQYEVAVALVHKYSQATPGNSRKIIINVIKSDFLGSIWD